MLKWTLIFAILALIAGVFGFGFIASGFATVAKFLFFLFIALFVVSMVSRAVQGESVA
ncbi:MAG TPA: DUF1328 domain-containing protein [Planctomycetaceae bacterium]|nr:DUF1328 domain-containing protein [Planctomycetaceae bacterium]